MYEIDKTAFADFFAKLRKEKGYTQKEIAAKLFVSDKAVSKWERGLSMPDISLLMPLAELLDVSVTELLEGRILEQDADIDTAHVEALVKKALAFSEESPEKKKERMKKRVFIFGGCIVLTILELIFGFYFLNADGWEAFIAVPLTLELLSFIFGLYFWFLVKERLPAYYDENRISACNDGFFKMNIPGVSFNNTNWPYILKTGRIWTAVTMTTIPLLWFLSISLPFEFAESFTLQMILLFLYLGGLFLPMYIVGRKYDNTPEYEEKNKKQYASIFLLPVLIAVCVFLLLFFSGSSLRSGIRLGFSEHGTRSEWTAHYQRLDGTMRKTIYPSEDASSYLISVDTKKGSLSIVLTEKDGDIVFSETNIASGTYLVTLTKAVKTVITADGHRGSFSIEPQ